MPVRSARLGRKPLDTDMRTPPAWWRGAVALEPWIKRDTRDAWIMVFPVVVILFNQFSLASVPLLPVFFLGGRIWTGECTMASREGNLYVLFALPNRSRPSNYSRIHWQERATRSQRC